MVVVATDESLSFALSPDARRIAFAASGAGWRQQNCHLGWRGIYKIGQRARLATVSLEVTGLRLRCSS